MTFALIVLAALFTLPPQTSDAVVGVTAIHLESNRRVSVNGHDHFPMASVFKFPTALTVLRRVDTGTLALHKRITIEPENFSLGYSPLRDHANGRAVSLTVGGLLELMVVDGDNTAADALLELVGGPQAVTRRIRELAIGGIRVDRSEKQIVLDLGKPGGESAFMRDIRDSATPDAMADLLVAFWQRRAGLSDTSHEFLLRMMTEAKRGDRRIKAGVPAGSRVAHRTGTMRSSTNHVALVTLPDGGHIAIAIFTKNRKNASTEDAEDDIAAATRAAITALAD
jgi:beta-lactamase class A